MLRALIKIKNKLLFNNKSHNTSKSSLHDYNIIQEGEAKILFPEQEVVFYNPIQQFNRDLSVTCIKAWDNLYGSAKYQNKNKKKRSMSDDIDENNVTKKRKLINGEEKVVRYEKPYIKILEALSATGLRSIRYACEIRNVKEVIANDLLPTSVESINRNIEYNNMGHIVKGNLDDANDLMYRCKSKGNKFHIVDLDPYGTATPFIDAAMQIIEDDGLMLVTCTDLSVLAGNGYPEKCFALYGGVNMAGHDSTHESALRLVLNMLGQSAAKYKKCIEPLLSLSIDFYVRVFIKVKTSPNKVKNLQKNTMIGFMCSGCKSYHIQPLGRQTTRETKKGKPFTKYSLAQGPAIGTHCSFCGNVHHIFGPMYAGSLHNHEFVEQVLKINREENRDDIYGTRKRIEGMLTLAKNELDTPFYFTPNSISSILKFQVPSLRTVVAGLGSLGYDCSLTHAKPSSLKTNAPWEAIWFIMKKYGLNNDLIDSKKINQNSVGHKILSNNLIGNDEWSSKLSFEPNDQSEKTEKLRKLKIIRFQENPTRNWGPKARPQSL